MTERVHKELAYEIVGCAMEVHKTLGPGFLEPVYEEAFKVELQQKKMFLKNHFRSYTKGSNSRTTYQFWPKIA
ncbi:MAG: GxxExxY protein [Candidatus Marinimicrobia bacterium]|nr:GxxExxY protein [Candidatus Neomarinimicrobiota bacterium]